MAFYVISSEKVIQVVHTNDTQAYYSTPYYEEWAVEDFKAAVPWQSRLWNPATKTWTASIEYLDALKNLADAFGPVEILAD